jgi:hypothetical protein
MREGGFCATLFQAARKSLILNGEMSEWLKEHAWKACVGETLPRVRIPLSPPILKSSYFLDDFADLCAKSLTVTFSSVIAIAAGGIHRFLRLRQTQAIS